MARASINPFGLGAGLFSVVLLTKAVSYLTPYKLYFSFSSFLYNQRDAFKWEGLSLKLAIPCLVGFLLFYLPFLWMQFVADSSISFRRVYRYLSTQSGLTARAVGFLSSLLLAWPFMVYWDVLMDPTLQAQQLPFIGIYLLYFISYSYFGGLGTDLARMVLRRRLPKPLTAPSGLRVAWLDAARVSFMGILTSAIATHFASVVGTAR